MHEDTGAVAGLDGVVVQSFDGEVVDGLALAGRLDREDFDRLAFGCSQAVVFLQFTDCEPALVLV